MFYIWSGVPLVHRVPVTGKLLGAVQTVLKPSLDNKKQEETKGRVRKSLFKGWQCRPYAAASLPRLPYSTTVYTASCYNTSVRTSHITSTRCYLHARGGVYNCWRRSHMLEIIQWPVARAPRKLMAVASLTSYTTFSHRCSWWRLRRPPPQAHPI